MSMGSVDSRLRNGTALQKSSHPICFNAAVYSCVDQHFLIGCVSTYDEATLLLRSTVGLRKSGS
jgi:hypothetical protein